MAAPEPHDPKKPSLLTVFDVTAKTILAVIGLSVGWYTFTTENRVRSHEIRLREIEMLNSLVPALFSDDSIKAGAAYLLMRRDSTLAETADNLPAEMQRRLSAALPFRDVVRAAASDGPRADTSNPYLKPLEAQFTSSPGSRVGTPAAGRERDNAGRNDPDTPGGAAAPTGWIYLGAFSGGRWQTRYLDFPAALPPDSLKRRQFTVPERTGAVNVRNAMLSVPNVLPAAIDSIAPGHRVTVVDVREWVDRGTPTGYIWANVRY